MREALIISLVALLGVTKAFSQIPVTDATQASINQAGWEESLAKAASQIEVLGKSRDILKQSVDLYAKVNTALQNSRIVISVIDRQVKIVKFCSQEFSRTDFSNPKMFAKYSAKLSEILEEGQNIFSMAKMILTPSVQMTDGERIQMLNDLNKQTKECYSKLQNSKHRFDTFNSAMRRVKR